MDQLNKCQSVQVIDYALVNYLFLKQNLHQRIMSINITILTDTVAIKEWNIIP
jgi:hypothetical protein